jgi:hypothetical protein
MSLYLGDNLISGTQIVTDKSERIGQIIPSTIPLTDAGLHLLDGALISGSGSYSEFVDYIAGLVSDYPDLFETEANWQQSVTDYGVCGKFVYDDVNNTVRLPKITGIVEGTTDLSALGDLVEAGLPSITGSCFAWKYGTTGGSGSYTGALSNNGEGGGEAYYCQNTSGSHPLWGIKFNAADSNAIYGNSSTVQPQTIKVLYYIVIATTTKTDIEVDIDEIVTDLNGKADVDLSNCTKPHIVETYKNGTEWYRVWSDGWCEQGGVASMTTYTTFLKPYKDNNYGLFTQMSTNGYVDTFYNQVVYYRDNAGFTSNIYHGNNGIGFNWFACGYIS